MSEEEIDPVKQFLAAGGKIKKAGNDPKGRKGTLLKIERKTGTSGRAIGICLSVQFGDADKPTNVAAGENNTQDLKVGNQYYFPVKIFEGGTYGEHKITHRLKSQPTEVKTTPEHDRDFGITD
jgi:hypothetical protein